MSDAKQCAGCDGDGWLSHVDGRVDCDVCGGSRAIAGLVDEGATPGADLGSAIEQQCAQWEAKLAIERGNSAQLLAASTRCTEVATKARASAVEVRAVGGPVAETAALHLEAVARSLSDLAVAAGVTALAVFVTEGE